MSREKIHLDLVGGHLFDGKQVHHVKRGEEIKIDQDTFHYTIKTFQFVSADGKGVETKRDGCLFEIEPGNSTRAMKLTKEGYVSQRCVVEGSGWYLSNQNGVTSWTRVSSDYSDNGMIEMETGAVDCWIADPKDPRGLKVIDISEPPFDPKFEVEQKREKNEPSKRFWEIREKLLKGEDPDGEYKEAVFELLALFVLQDYYSERSYMRNLRNFYFSPFGFWPF